MINKFKSSKIIIPIVILCFFYLITYSTETIKLTDEQMESIKSETCDKIKASFDRSELGTILNIPDTLKNALMLNLTDSQFVVFKKPYIINITDCELEIFTDSLAFFKIKTNIINNNFINSKKKMRVAIPKIIDYTRKTFAPRSLESMEECILEEYIKNQICFGIVNSHLTVKTAGYTISNAKFIRIDIKAENYKTLK